LGRRHRRRARPRRPGGGHVPQPRWTPGRRHRGGAAMSMRSRFYSRAAQALEDDERVWVVLADIGAAELPSHPRVVNVGIREQLMIGVAAGLGLAGKRPIVHSYAPFLVERPWEQIKLDLGHNDV